MVLVNIPSPARDPILELEKSLMDRYMPGVHDGSQSDFIFPSLGEDFSKAYGYAQEHHTLELWFYIWLAHKKDVENNGTPPTIRRIIDIVTSFWNKCMGNVDILRRVVKSARAVRGKDSKPGALFWFTLFDFIFYQAFRIYQHGKIEHKLESFHTFAQFRRERRRNNSFRAFLYELKKELSSQRLSKLFPGLKERIDSYATEMPQLPSSRDNSIAAIAAASSIEPALSRSNKRTTKSYKQISEFLDPRTEKYANRLNKLCNHVAIKTTAKKGEKITEKVMTSDGTVQVMERSTDRAARYSCLCCCEKCDDHVKHPTRDAHYRAGRRTSMYCSVCRVFICSKCWDSFHNDVVPKLSPCLARNYATAMQTRSSETCAIVTSRNTPPRSSRSRPLSMNRAASGTSPAKRKRVSNATDQSNSSSSPRKRSRLQGSPVRRILDRNRKERRSMRINSAAATVGADDDTPALRGGKKRKPKAKPKAPKKLKRKRSRK
mmetsp:Transcript_15982/g.35779  ORF Transcript_15982/g.35779 Transcript_15982/m.35779 type:complete len:490 (+) Transcript_15982:2002-3471(+)